MKLDQSQQSVIHGMIMNIQCFSSICQWYYQSLSFHLCWCFLEKLLDWKLKMPRSERTSKKRQRNWAELQCSTAKCLKIDTFFSKSELKCHYFTILSNNYCKLDPGIMMDQIVKAVSDGRTSENNNDHYACTDEKPPAIYSVVSLLFLALPWLRDSLLVLCTSIWLIVFNSRWWTEMLNR